MDDFDIWAKGICPRCNGSDVDIDITERDIVTIVCEHCDHERREWQWTEIKSCHNCKHVDRLKLSSPIL